jgi:hypothetical protein
MTMSDSDDDQVYDDPQVNSVPEAAPDGFLTANDAVEEDDDDDNQETQDIGYDDDDRLVDTDATQAYDVSDIPTQPFGTALISPYNPSFPFPFSRTHRQRKLTPIVMILISEEEAWMVLVRRKRMMRRPLKNNKRW